MLGDATSMTSYYCSSPFFVSLKLCPITIYHIQYRISVSLDVSFFIHKKESANNQNKEEKNKEKDKKR